MTSDSSHTAPNRPESDSALPYTQDSFSDTLLWAAGLSKSAGDNIQNRMDTLAKREEALTEQLTKPGLSADDRANTEAALKLVTKVQDSLKSDAHALDTLTHMHSDHAQTMSGMGDANIPDVMATAPIIPGDSPHKVIGKSLMLAAATRTALGYSTSAQHTAKFQPSQTPGIKR